MSQKRIEDVFSEALENDQAAWQEGDWDQMTQLLNSSEAKPEEKQRRRKWLFFIIPPVALLLLLLLVYPFQSTKKQVAAETKSQQGALPNAPKQLSEMEQAPVNQKENYQGASSENKIGSGGSNKAETEMAPVNPSNAKTNKGNGMPDIRKIPVSENNEKATLAHLSDANAAMPATVPKPQSNTRSKIGKEINREKDDLKTLFYEKKGNSRQRDRKNGSDANEKFVKNRLDKNNDSEKLFNDFSANMEASEYANLEMLNEKPHDNESGVLAGALTSNELDEPDNRILEETIIVKTAKGGKAKTTAGKKQSLLKRISQTALGLPQWVSVGYEFLPWSATGYSYVPDFNTFSAFPRQSSTVFQLDSANPVKMSKGFHIAIGSEWYPSGEKWSLNSYVMMQYAKTRQISRSYLSALGANAYIFDTLVQVNNIGVLRLGADWVRHSKNDRWQVGLGANISVIARSRGDIYDYNYALGINGGGGTSGIGSSNGLFKGLRQFNMGLTGIVNRHVSGKVWLEARVGFDFMDMTRNGYFKNNLRHNLSYVSLGLRYSLQKNK
jgi:hypothetical protein